MSNIISKFADVHPHAVLGEGVRIGPFCSIGANAKIGAGSILDSNVTVTGHAIIGKPATKPDGHPQVFERNSEPSSNPRPSISRTDG